MTFTLRIPSNHISGNYNTRYIDAQRNTMLTHTCPFFFDTVYASSPIYARFDHTRLTQKGTKVEQAVPLVQSTIDIGKHSVVAPESRLDIPFASKRQGGEKRIRRWLRV